ncbi:DUF742 domain-containing protein [Streptomyces sp. RB6PN23]|uniref:DUF742 domain-containing protein n=2 Tax=Streptomyces silvisoli TaxID=3034235 RepID=A0ABT5ZKK9_9ACTN|nr:DUF742 domain-containing protein [Streptomyces silvisoli]MDF3290367.1 DUF742 domain-containing protein [Streptomyces silvisoli]
MDRLPGESGALWYDDEAGPMVRPYTVTRGRTQPDAAAADIELITVVAADAGTGTEACGDALGEDHLALLERCVGQPRSVAELASEADLPVAVVRVLLGDLLDAGRVHVVPPDVSGERPDVGVLRHVIDGLKSL